MRQYYHKKKYPKHCQHCGELFCSKITLAHHEKNNLACRVFRLQALANSERPEDASRLTEIMRDEINELSTKMKKRSFGVHT